MVMAGVFTNVLPSHQMQVIDHLPGQSAREDSKLLCQVCPGLYDRTNARNNSNDQMSLLARETTD
jgi:hypothetical protein